MLLRSYLGEEIETHGAPTLRVNRQPSQEKRHPYWHLQVVDGDGWEDVAIMRTKRAAQDLRSRIDEIARVFLKGYDAANDTPEINVPTLITPKDIHAKFRDDFGDFINPPPPTMAGGAAIPQGLNFGAIFGYGGTEEVPQGYPKQRQFIRAERKFALWVGGRGSGKSHALGIKAFILAMMNPGTPGLLLSRTYNELHTVLLPNFYKAVEQFKVATGIDVVAHVNRSLQMITLINGAVIILRSWDRIDKLRSYTVSWICLDEIEKGVAGNARYAFTTIGACLRHPMAVHRQFCMATTPNGLTGVTELFRNTIMDHNRNPDPAKPCEFHITHACSKDNPFLPDDYDEQLRLSMSKREYQQEALGMLLGPTSQVFVEYSETKHVIDWEWDPELPYMVGVDWGTSHAYICHVQLEVMPGEYGYRWVVAWEEKLEDVGPMDVRRALEDSIKMRGKPPLLICADRAVRSQNSWARARFGESMFLTCHTKMEQRVPTGLNHMRFMLDPPEDSPGPLLVFSRELRSDSHKSGRGLRGSMIGYQYKSNSDGTLSNEPHKDDVNDHPIDALRYLVVMSADYSEYHGGDVLKSKYPASLVLAA